MPTRTIQKENRTNIKIITFSKIFFYNFELRTILTVFSINNIFNILQYPRGL